MEQTLINGLTVWQFEGLSRQSSIVHFVTDRRSWVQGHEFTLSFSSLPDRAVIRNNRSVLAKAMGIPEGRLYFPSQVHKTRIVRVTPETLTEDLMETDALITDEPGICIAVMSADCVPVLLYDKKNNAIAAVHSGWRGTVSRILEKTLHEMQRVFDTKGEDISAGIGPSVSFECYEVGEEVVEEVRRSFANGNELLVPTVNKKAKLDLWNANRIQLKEFGVADSNIEVSDLCTIKHNEHFFSARKGDKGRFAAGIMLRS